MQELIGVGQRRARVVAIGGKQRNRAVS